jgi:hypothetical protein
MLMIGQHANAAAFDMAIGHQNGPSYSLGIAISSLVKVKLLPSTEIDLNALVTANDLESMEALAGG